MKKSELISVLAKHADVSKTEVGHDSKEAAVVAIRKTRAENQKNGTVRAVALKAYLCHCGKWHIGHGKRLDWKYLEKIL